MKRRSLRSRKGIALIVVFVLVMLVSLAAYRFSFEMQSEYRLAKLYEEQLLARQAANSGIEQACNLLDSPLAMRIDLVGSQETRIDSEGTPFRGLITSSDSIEAATGPAEQPWRYVLISPLSTLGNVQGERNDGVAASDLDRTATDASASAWRFGFENESAKISIQALREWERTKPGHARTVLSRIPGLAPEIIDPWLIQAGILVPGPVSSLTGAPIGSGLDRNSTQSSSGLSPGATSVSADRGLFAAQWLGGDLNQNYQIEAIEQRLWDKRSLASSAQGLPVVSSTTEPIAMQRYFTKYSASRNERWDGTPRIDLNTIDLRALHRDLMGIWPQQLADFVIAMRQYGPSGNPPSRPTADGGFSSSPSAARGQPSRPSAEIGQSSRSLGVVGQPSRSPVQVNRPSTSTAEVNRPSRPPAEANRSSRSLVNVGQLAQSSSAARSGVSNPSGESVGTPDWSVPSRYQFRSLLDLVDASIQISGAAGTTSSQTKTITSPFISGNGDNSNYLVRLLDDGSIDRSSYYEGRVDIWDAPWEVLMAIPSMDDATASRIVAARNDESIKVQSAGTIAWLLQRSIVTLEKARELEPFLTGRSDVYSVQVVGYREARSPVYRCTMTIDGSQRPSKPLDLKTWHAWDAGFNLVSFDGNRN